MEFHELIKHANAVYGSRKIARNAWVGSVAAAILSEKGRVFTGVCIDVSSGMGFCAEHAAVAAMITSGESRIIKMVAIGETGVVPPCGRCREFVNQIHDKNIHTEVMVNDRTVVTLGDLLPFSTEKNDGSAAMP